MPFGPQDLMSLSGRGYILGNTTIEEQAEFIMDQIRDPFGSGDTNYYRKFAKMVSSQDELDERCAKFFTAIQDVYPNLIIDVSEYESHLNTLFNAVYKFFIKNAERMMYIFIREYLFNNKNRKGLTDEFSDSRMSSYPKEQYGKKEYYILVTKLSRIIDTVFEEDNITLEKYIKYIERSDDAPVYLDVIQDAMDRGYIGDNGVTTDMYQLFKASDQYRSTLNRLEMDINAVFITPYLESNGIAGIRIPPTEEIPPDDDDEEEDEDEED